MNDRVKYFYDMTDERETHLDEIKTEFLHLVDEKYRIGQKNHGGNLFEQTSNKLLNNAIEEAIDMVVYLLTLKNKLNEG